MTTTAANATRGFISAAAHGRHAALFVAVALFFSLLPTASMGSPGKLVWKPVEGSSMKLNDNAPRQWRIYLAEKKQNLLLVQLGHRYLIVDTRARAVYDIPPRQVQFEKDNAIAAEPDAETRRIPVMHWEDRDIGPAEQIRIRLGDYGQMVELQVRHLPDLRAFY